MAADTAADPIRVGSVTDVPEGETLLVPAATTGTVPISVFHAEDGEFYALDDRCTHGAASLSEGWVEDDQIECPLHGAAFCLRTGAALTLPATVNTNTHRVEVDGEDLLLYPGTAASS